MTLRKQTESSSEEVVLDSHTLHKLISTPNAEFIFNNDNAQMLSLTNLSIPKEVRIHFTLPLHIKI